MRNERGYVILQMTAIMADVFSDPNAKIRNPTSSLLNFKNRLTKFQDIYARVGNQLAGTMYYQRSVRRN